MKDRHGNTLGQWFLAVVLFSALFLLFWTAVAGSMDVWASIDGAIEAGRSFLFVLFD